MPIFPTNLGQALLTTDWSAVYASPVLGRTIMKSIFLCNVSVAQTLVDIALLRTGEDVPADKNILFTQRPIEALMSDIVNEVIVFEPGDRLFAKASSPTSMLMSGVVATDISHFTKHADLQEILGDGPYHLGEDQWRGILAANEPSATNRFITLADMANLNWKIITTDDYVSEAWDALFVDTSGGPKRVYLPANPVLGSVVKFADCAGTFEAFPLTVACNGKPIMGLLEDMTVYTSNHSFSLTFTDDTNGWRLT